jgi:hypothetical protein
MHEDFLHYLWRTHRFDLENLKTTNGEAIEIFHFGEYNTHAGADFQNARIRIAGIEWVGNVEMHIKASDWLAHGHQHDKAYNNVILHVVYEEDMPIPRIQNEPTSINREEVPCLVLKDRISENIFKKYKYLLNNAAWIPCQTALPDVPQLVKDMWLERLVIERLERKTEEIALALVHNRNDWEETFYQFMARNFGMKVNAEPMIWLAQSLPHLILAKHKNKLSQIEALLFGQAGMLDGDFNDDYPNKLKKEYHFLKHKYQLNPIPIASWKYARMRPLSFPTVKLAQFAALIHRSSHMFSKVLDSEHITDVKNLFNIEVSEYWTAHYVLDTPVLSKDNKSEKAVKSVKKLGAETIDLFLINTIIPFLFYYGKFKNAQEYKDRALQFLEKIKPEKNALTEGWQTLNMPAQNAAQSQAQIELKTRYCDAKQCLNCAIGNKILTL